jgi:phenylacetate-CoA ligase
MAESYIVELVKGDAEPGLGETGEVLITDLNNYCLPFIRYRIGDLATAVNTSCPCGRGLPLIGEIMGRVQAIIYGSDGQYLPGTFFAHFMKDYHAEIRQFQVVQFRKGEVIVKIVSETSGMSQRSLQTLESTLKTHLGENTQLRVEFVKEIPLTRTGKHLHSISYVPFDEGVSRH